MHAVFCFCVDIIHKRVSRSVFFKSLFLSFTTVMPRYCAVKVCKNRRGTAARQDSKRISFYPFPLHDQLRLQKWVDNMKREHWTPSRHQYLCSEHFTEDCFDIRWGIRYLKTTATPTMFPPAEDDGEKKVNTIKRNPKAKASTSDIVADPKGFDVPLEKKPLILSGTHASPSNGSFAGHTEEAPRMSDAVISCQSDPSQIQTAACEVADDGALPKAPCFPLSPCHEPPEKRTDSTVTVFCCESLDFSSEGESNMDGPALEAALSQASGFISIENPTDCILEEVGPGDGEQISIYEHSYCRPDTDKDQLWSKILNLHTKLLELDRMEENTVAKIHALENEIILLKRNSAVFEEKQKVLEDFISSVLI